MPVELIRLRKQLLTLLKLILGIEEINAISLTEDYRRTTRLIDTIMAPSRHLVCGSCSSWIQFDSSGCTISWAEMRKSTSVFTCKGCTEVAMLVGEVEDLRKMMESLKRMVTGQGLEEKIGETGDQEA